MSSYPPDRDNGRVTNAILSTKLDALTLDVRKLADSVNRRVDFLEEKMDIRFDTVAGRCRDNETNIARLDERQKATTGIMGVIQAATIAATTWLGLS